MAPGLEMSALQESSTSIRSAALADSIAAAAEALPGAPRGGLLAPRPNLDQQRAQLHDAARHTPWQCTFNADTSGPQFSHIKCNATILAGTTACMQQRDPGTKQRCVCVINHGAIHTSTAAAFPAAFGTEA
jgi:hypothetical protein